MTHIQFGAAAKILLAKTVGFGVVAASLALASPAAMAQTRYAVSKLRYQNDGAYSAFPRVILGDCSVRSIFGVTAGKSLTYELGGNNSNDWKVDGDETDCNTAIAAGTEVWMRIAIRWAETKDCRKDETHFYYQPGGGTVKYTSRGTTKNGNRCRIASKPSDSHLLSSE